MPSQAEIEQYQQDVEELSALAVAEITAVVVALSGEDDETLVSAVPPVLEPYMAAAADLATSFYRGLAREEPREPKQRKGAPEPMSGPTGRVALLDAAEFEPRPAALPPREQIEATVWWALAAEREPEAQREEAEPEVGSRDGVAAEVREPREPSEAREPEPASEPEPVEPEHPAEETPRARVVPAEEAEQQARVVAPEEEQPRARVIARLSGATQRYVTTAARDTITENADREGVRWARHAKPDACAFCRLLATRGTDYLTEESAKFVGTGRIRGPRKKGEEYHDDCQCEPVAVRAGDTYEPPDYVTAWDSQYEKAVATAGNRFNTRAILAEMRRLERQEGGSRH